MDDGRRTESISIQSGEINKFPWEASKSNAITGIFIRTLSIAKRSGFHFLRYDFRERGIRK